MKTYVNRINTVLFHSRGVWYIIVITRCRDCTHTRDCQKCHVPFRAKSVSLGGANHVEHAHTIRFIRLRIRPCVAPRFRRDESVAMAIPAAVVTAPLDEHDSF